MARTRGGSARGRGRGRGPRSTRSRNVETRSTRAGTPVGDNQQQQAFIMNTLHMMTGLMQGLVQNASAGGTSTDTNGTMNGEAKGTTHQQFMSLHPPKFHGKGTADDAEQWIIETEEIFTTLDVPDNKKVRYGTFMLKGDAKEWWRTQREVKFTNHELTWGEFKEASTHAYIPTFTWEKRMQEFLDLQQGSLSLHEYIVKLRHLEKYCPHVYTADADRANKFVRGLKDGLQNQVISSRPRDLDDAIDMATRLEERWNRMQETNKRSEFLRSKLRPDMRSDKVNQGDRFKRQRPSTSRQDEECPTCHRQHPGKPCYREVGACLYCGTRGHFIHECPKKKEAVQR
uniref:CCHC-type domain-containing protein n=1 Tax=Nymphaea colorata TaxID=210225 RepID=A0A5K0Y0H8_9MAGN